jgi:hypothetical protein
MESEDILDKEIESWKGFEYALREENRTLFNKMLSNKEEYDNKVGGGKTWLRNTSPNSTLFVLCFE